VEQIPNSPFFVSLPESKNSGVDFLGMGPVGERLIAYALPGITNAQQFIKPYGFAAWVVWKFHQNLQTLSKEGKPLPRPPREQFKLFREKAELFFSWANLDYVGAVGNSRQYPTAAGLVVMEFNNDVFGADTSQASWFAAATYGPSFNEGTGLGYIKPFKGLYETTPLGAAVAEMLDKKLSIHKKAYDRLCSMEDQRAGLVNVKDLADALNLENKSPKESGLFRNALFAEALIGVKDGSHGNRATTLALILNALRAEKSSTPDDVRRAISLGITATGKRLKLDSLEEMQQIWFVISVRQLQRLAFERLLRWFEYQLCTADSNAVELEAIYAKGAIELDAAWPQQVQKNVGGILTTLERQIERNGGCMEAPQNDPTLSQFEFVAKLQTLGKGGERDIPATSLKSMLLAVAITRLVGPSLSEPNPLAIGGKDRISLTWFEAFIRSRESLSCSVLLREILSNLIFAQHLKTSAAKFEAGKNKFRFTYDERGVEPLIELVGINGQGVTPDRIETALRLMADCGMISVNDEFEYSAL
jgi:hypothetical protein